MDIEIRPQPLHTCVAFRGILDEHSKAAFDEHLHPLLEKGATRLLIDLSACPRATSAGLGHLVTFVSRANTKGGQVVFASPTPFLRTVLHATKLTKFLDLVDSLEEAERQLASP